MDKKFELVKSTRTFLKFDENGKRWKALFRIKALKDFNDVKKGDLGGFVESEENLSQDGDCWIYNDAEVVGNVRVCDNAIVADNAKIEGDVVIKDNSKVLGKSRLCNNVVVCDNAIVSGNTTRKSGIIKGDRHNCNSLPHLTGWK